MKQQSNDIHSDDFFFNLKLNEKDNVKLIIN